MPAGRGFWPTGPARSRFDIVPLALTALARLDHRGGLGADGQTGDGAGLLTAIPWALLVAESGNGIEAPMAEEGFGVGSLFLPDDAAEQERGIEIMESALRSQGLDLVARRDVPTNDAVLGPLGLRFEAAPSAHRGFAAGRDRGRRITNTVSSSRAGKRKPSRARRGSRASSSPRSSHRTIVYKALLRGSQLRDFYADLRSREYRTPFAVFHNRFSTNTHPSWSRAQPFRQIAHNGEINTIDGNRRWMEARGLAGAGRGLGLSEAASRPMLPKNASDSASLDEAFSLLTAAGHSSIEALSMLVPPAWENDRESVRGQPGDFHEAASTMIEPWDGPALIAFSDGRLAGAMLDRNGLRPARTVLTRDNLVLVASEAGVLDVEPDRIAERGRLGTRGLSGRGSRAGTV